MKGLQQTRSWQEISTCWFKSPVMLICIPICMVGMLLAWTAYSELQASRQIQNELRLVAEEGYPTTEAEIENEFMTKTSTEGTLAMNRIEILSTMPMNFGRSSTIPYMAGDVRPLVDLVPGVPWPEEARVAEFLLHFEPLLNEVVQLEKVARPVWMPRIPTHSPYSRSSFVGLYQMDRILRLAFDHAVYHKDSERAMGLLRSVTLMTESIDWRLNAFGDMYINLKPQLYTMVNRSMVSKIWSKSQLQELHRQVAEPINLAARWRRIIALGIAGYSQWFESRQSNENQHEALRSLRSLRDWKTLFDGSFQSIGQRINKIIAPSGFEESSEEPTQEESRSFATLFGLNTIDALFDLELLRRHTLVAIAIKEYEMENGRWPKQLSDLDAFGLTADDWAPPGRREWKYEFDNSEARLSSSVKPKYAIYSAGRLLKFQEMIRIR